MKPTKKKTAKRPPPNPVVTKLLDLKYRINDAYRSYPHETNKNDKDWVIARIRDMRDGKTLTKGEMLHCNNLWKEYSPSRLNDWVGYKND
jgi:hypothetical protein